MLGAIIGDMYGSIYEFNNVKDKRLVYFTQYSYPTDDSVMTMAVARALTGYTGDADEFYELCVTQMNAYGKRFPDAGYGSRVKKWLKSKPYGSYGNGSAMRVSPVGWYADSLEEALKLAEITALPTHDHPEGIKGAQAVASAVYLLRTGSTKEEVKKYIEETFGYDLSRKLDDIRPDYTFHVSCQKSVPEAFMAFLEATDFVDAIKTAISIGGDSDTIACIAGALAETYYKIPDELIGKVIQNLRSLGGVITREDFAFYDEVVSRRNRFKNLFAL